MPNQFYLNNSSLPILACSMQYNYRVVKGLKPPPGGNKYTPLGLAFHQAIQHKAEKKVDNLSLLLLLDSKSALIPPRLAALTNEADRLHIGMMADRVYNEYQSIYADCKTEHEFVSTSPDDAGLPVTPLRAGTIDLLSYDAQAERLDVIDYKTTSKPIDGQLFRNYQLSAQRWYYMAGLQLIADSLPDHYRDAINSARFGFRYIYVSMVKPETVIQPPSLVDINELNAFRRQFAEKAYLASHLHADESLAVREGILSGLCWKCPFANICAGVYTEDSWPYGRAPYTHKHDNE